MEVVIGCACYVRLEGVVEVVVGGRSGDGRSKWLWEVVVVFGVVVQGGRGSYLELESRVMSQVTVRTNRKGAQLRSLPVLHNERSESA